VEERRIVWDETKNAENKRKHKIDFEVAQYVCLPIRYEYGGLTGAKAIRLEKIAGKLSAKSGKSFLWYTQSRKKAQQM